MPPKPKSAVALKGLLEGNTTEALEEKSEIAEVKTNFTETADNSTIVTEENSTLTLEQAWEKAITPYQNQIRIHIALKTSKPVIDDFGTIHLTLKSETQIELIDDVKPRLTEYLKSLLNLKEVSLQYKVDENFEFVKPDNPIERNPAVMPKNKIQTNELLASMINKNIALEELIDTFGLICK